MHSVGLFHLPDRSSLNLAHSCWPGAVQRRPRGIQKRQCRLTLGQPFLERWGWHRQGPKEAEKARFMSCSAWLKVY